MLAAAANSAGGVMGKMIDAQSIVVAGVATGNRATKEAFCAMFSSTASLLLASWVSWCF